MILTVSEKLRDLQFRARSDDAKMAHLLSASGSDGYSEGMENELQWKQALSYDPVCPGMFTRRGKAPLGIGGKVLGSSDKNLFGRGEDGDDWNLFNEPGLPVSYRGAKEARRFYKTRIGWGRDRTGI
ncbi:hypothetical protein TNIN_109671 [Trichonephila inaurata madagascariensis]|uniref:Uncharacterized protein n=1 Tax=Trichonephila inaurata madagascariensis TaxID=2747483 RepID=A0A8X6I9D3_9ARAC|nr:hypothetical protein TNIN_109671 [Trichonephila inaurata madagascariensis]